MLRTLCEEFTTLTSEEIDCLEAVEVQLPLMAELTGADLFIDCAAENRALVVSQARPAKGVSAYRQDVVGQFALPDKEPAVFHAMQIHAPVRDLKAVTQEDRIVRQDAAPIFGPNGDCIGVLIREKDISSTLLQEKKFEELAKSYEQEDASLRSSQVPGCDATTLREVHHRVKNNLQLVASILNLQARRCGDAFTKKILQENVGRVLSIAAIHDILTQSKESFRQIDSLALLEKLRQNLQSFVQDGKSIVIRISGDSAPLNADTASSVSLVVNELITNALEHAFAAQDTGAISVSFCAGSLFHTITVSDDGSGFDPALPRKGSLGLSIVEATVRDKLRGHLRIYSDAGGTRVSFDFKTE